MHGRQLEGAGGAGHEDDGEDNGDTGPSPRAADGKRHRRRSLDKLRHAHHQPAIVTIGDVPDHECQDHHRHELDEPDQSEVKGAAGQIVDLPADGDRLHLEGGGRCHARAPEEHERALLPQARRGARRERGHERWNRSIVSG